MRGFLIEARKEKGLSMDDISKEIGIHKASYCNIENGRRNPSVDLAKRIAKFFGFSWTKFFE